MTLPSSAAGELNHAVGYIQAPLATVAPWLRDGMGDKWEMRPVQWQSLADAAFWIYLRGAGDFAGGRQLVG